MFHAALNIFGANVVAAHSALELAFAVLHLAGAALAAWAEAMGPVLQEVLPGVRPVTYGHVGDGNLHYNLNAPVGADDDLRAAAVELSTAIYDSVAAGNGSISAEHGLGRAKAAAGASYKSAVEVDLMRALKHALDPDGLMNPGVLLPPA